MDDWDVLVYAQHYGMVTRLLDWSKNPLIALWYACCNQDIKTSSWVYLFVPPKDAFLDSDARKLSPFSFGKTKVLKPTWNNTRILAQAGWFTVHQFSKKEKKFVALDNNSDYTKLIYAMKIPGNLKADLLKQLSLLGINHQTVCPDMLGLCKHLNWDQGY